MSETSRRKFLAAAGVGAAAGTVALATGGAAAGATKKSGAACEPVLAVVDHRSSEVRLLVGEREVVVHDRDLVTRILNAAGGE